MRRDALELALKMLQYINQVEHPVHLATLPGEIEMVIERLHQALEQQPIAWYHRASKRIRWDGDNLGESWIPLYTNRS